MGPAKIKKFSSDFIAFDVETATSDLSSLCQIGFCRGNTGSGEAWGHGGMEAEKLGSGEAGMPGGGEAGIFYSASYFVKPPGNEYTAANSCVHGIDALRTKDAPAFPVIWSCIREIFTSNLLVAHNASFDISVLRATLRFYHLDVPSFTYEDTFKMTGLGLAPMCDALEIKMTRHHDALSDAVACGEAYIKLKNGIMPDYQLIRARSRKNIFAGHEPISAHLLVPDLENADPGHPFYNKRVVFTGVLDRMSRDDAAKLARANGAIIDHTVSQQTQIVIAGSGAGPAKLKKIEQFNAEGAGIRIINEDEFLEMIGGI